MRRGTFIAVVGPSGAGKDTLIEAAVARRDDIVRARRVITRPPAPGSEEFESASEAAFARRARTGEFVLFWRAHGLSYGIPASVEADLAAGRHVLANLSRGVIAAAESRLAPVRVMVVSAPLDVLAGRLAARGRETAEDIRARLARAGFAAPEGPDVHLVENAGGLEAGIAAFLAALPQPVSG